MPPTAYPLATICIAFTDTSSAQSYKQYLHKKSGVAQLIIFKCLNHLLQDMPAHNYIIILLDQSFTGITSMRDIEIVQQKINNGQLVLFCNEGTPAQIRSALKLKCHSYIAKSTDWEIKTKLLKNIINRTSQIDSCLTNAALINSNLSLNCVAIHFTCRENDILELKLKLIARKQICRELNMSVETYRTHLSNMNTKCENAGYLDLKDYLKKILSGQ